MESYAISKHQTWVQVRESHIGIFETHPLSELQVVKTMSIQILLSQSVQVVTEVIVDLVSVLGVYFSLQGKFILAKNSDVLSLRMVHSAGHWVVFPFDCHHELSSLMCVYC